MYWIDAHSHISFFDHKEVAAALDRGAARDLCFWMMAGYDAQDWKMQLELVKIYPGKLATAFGLHPWRVIELSKFAIEQEMKKLSEILPFAKAMGETGIDKFKTQESGLVQQQMDIFFQHLHLNQAYQLPLILHAVQSENEVLAALKKYNYTGIVHGFSGSYESAKRYIDLGYKISIGRGVFHKGYRQLKECVQKISMEDMVLESDSALFAEGGAEDAVTLFFKVVEAVSEIKKIAPSELMQKNFLNFKKVFNL